MKSGAAADGRVHEGRQLPRVAACLFLGLLINFVVAAGLGARPDRGPAATGFGFVSRTFAPTVNWCGGRGRDLLAIASDPGLEGATLAELESRFRSVFGPPNGSMTAADLDTWSTRLFPGWGTWAYGVKAHDGSRRVYAAGFPLRSFAGYDSGAHVSFSVPAPAGPYRQVGFIWRDGNSPIRAVVCIPLARGTIVNSTIYGMAAAGIAFFPVFRRSFRRHRGRCPCCNYDLRGDLAGGCPECGWNRP